MIFDLYQEEPRTMIGLCSPDARVNGTAVHVEWGNPGDAPAFYAGEINMHWKHENWKIFLFVQEGNTEPLRRYVLHCLSET